MEDIRRNLHADPSSRSREGESNAEPDSETVRPAGSWDGGFRLADPFANDLSGEESNEHMGEAWAVPWSDLMMVMFILFAVLFILDLSTPEVKTEKQPDPVVEYLEVPSPVDSPIEVPIPGSDENIVGADITKTLSINVFEESNEALERAELSDVEVALLSDQSVKVSVQGPMLFELGKADLREEVREFLDSLAFVIKKTPFRVRVIGHTDDKPINTTLFPSNWELSLFRASTVARYLIGVGEIDPTRFTVMGRGQYAPVASNSDDNARALNRRVEIIITREKNDEIRLSDSSESVTEIAEITIEEQR
jgi:chemotaxis protein MotB